MLDKLTEKWIDRQDRQVTYRGGRGVKKNLLKFVCCWSVNYFLLKHVTYNCNCMSFIVPMTTLCTKHYKLIFSLCKDICLYCNCDSTFLQERLNQRFSWNTQKNQCMDTCMTIFLPFHNSYQTLI